MVAGVICGLPPERPYFSCRDMAICAVTPLGNTNSAAFRSSSDDASVALGQELIAAKLNAAAGHAQPPADVVALGDTLISEAGDKLPLHERRTDYRGQGMLWVAASLSNHERDDECESETVPLTHSPTAVSTVLGSTRRTAPSALPGTGERSPFGSDPRSWIMTAMTMVIVILLVVLVRKTIAGREPDE